jgi:arginase family enzyme
VYGPITVIHFDSHLDTWPLGGYCGNDDLSLIAAKSPISLDADASNGVGFSRFMTF